ncbi:hypothetical protein [Micromonospora echinospora]|uniref:hypothetical protein n=1 Tax=Micromonospora echinospora TaxID=1877 RepID=UPI00366E07DB
MSSQTSGDPQVEFSERFRAAVENWAAARPDRPDKGRWPALISHLAAEEHNEDISDSTVRGWLGNSRRLPRSEDQLEIVLRVLGLRLDEDWRLALERARAARDAHARSTRQKQPTPPAGEPSPGEVSSDAGDRLEPSAQLDHVTTDEQPPGQPGDPAFVSDSDVTSAGPRKVPDGARSGASRATGGPRRSRWRVGFVTTVAVGAVGVSVGVLAGFVDVSTSTDRSVSPTAAPSPKRTGGSDTGMPSRPGADKSCRRGPSAGLPAQSAPRPTAYAPGGAGRAELFLDKRHIIVIDDRSDGCSVILTVHANGMQVGSWANSNGKTGKVKNGTAIPPKIVDLPWLDPDQRLDFRVCIGEVIERRPVFRDEDCGFWARVNQ